MMICTENKNSLKGQHNLAQGKRSGALGWKVDRKTVREDSMNKAKNSFRTELQSIIFPGRRFRFVPPSTMP